MQATMIAVGNELLSSDRVDTNSLFVADVLSGFGIELRRKVVVGDQLDDLVREVNRARSEAELVIVSGGLGPTQDDLTREAVAKALARGLERDPAIIEDIRAKFAAFGREMAAVNERQADVVEGAVVLTNPRGTAPGLRINVDGTTFFLFPGVPSELRGLVRDELEPWLVARAGDGKSERRVFQVACLPESDLEHLVEPFYREFGTEGLSILPSPGEISVRLSKSGAAKAREDWFEPRERLLGSLLAEYVFGRREESTLEGEVGRLLREAGKTLATAESCTGGGVAERITAVPGSSVYFLGSAVTYSNELKERMLGVEASVLAAKGAVSQEVAEAMALGVRDRLGADYGLSVTGVAGPGGGSLEKPVGTVHVALAGPESDAVSARRFQFPGDRSRVRKLTCQWALDFLRRRLVQIGDARASAVDSRNTA